MRHGRRGAVEVQTVRVEDMVQLRPSRRGNPRFRLMTDLGEFTTKADAALEMIHHELPDRVNLYLDGRGFVMGLGEAV